MNRFVKALIKVFYPQRCAYYGRVISSDELMCNDCKTSLPRIVGEVCVRCGREKSHCYCKKAEKFYNEIAAPFYFSGNVRKGIHSFKFRNCPDNAEAYGFEMSEIVKKRYSHIKFDYITEVPASEKSLSKRGYNQCSLLAERISANTGIEFRSNVLSKIYETNKQHGLKLFMRKGNLSGVFDVKNPQEVENKTILLCDDISTSGETLNECAKMLWLYGAKEIYCISVAVTDRKINKK